MPPESSESPDSGPEAQAARPPQTDAASPAPRGPGKQPGAPGFGRTQKLALTGTEVHHPLHCAACGGPLDAAAPASAWTGWDCIELAELPAAAGLQLQVTRHLLMEQRCACGHLRA